MHLRFGKYEVLTSWWGLRIVKERGTRKSRCVFNMRSPLYIIYGLKFKLRWLFQYKNKLHVDVQARQDDLIGKLDLYCYELLGELEAIMRIPKNIMCTEQSKELAELLIEINRVEKSKVLVAEIVRSSSTWPYLL